ncbi:MAG: Mini-ribonuclease 3 [Muricoprocola sp.]
MGESITEFTSYLDEQMGLPEIDLRDYSPLALAYIGDGVFELVIRTIVVKKANGPVQKMHKRASTLVKAAAQAEMSDRLMPELTEEEIAVFKRGRNAKSYTKAKNATVSEYRKATGLEALFGYLYLKKDMQRIADLIKKGLEGQDLNVIDTHNRK